ncbi:MAG: DUF4384 domain-containing protein [Myxococcales bacterium]|nr:DUF4384 domain-containing protein [Myxococcales bacterium]
MSEKRKIPDLLLEQAALSELPTRQAEEIRARIAADADAQARLAALPASDREILEQYPPRLLAAAIRRQAAASRSPRRAMARFLSPAMAALSAVALLVVGGFLLWPFLHGALPDSNEIAGGMERVKGDSRLFVHLKTDDEVRELRDGDVVRAGDLLQISYLAGDAAYGAIVSVDGGGNVTLHFPADPSASTRLDDGGVHSLPFAYELDRAPLFERFFFITAKTEIDVPRLLDVLRAASRDPKAGLSLAPGLTVTGLTLRKPTRNP